MKNLVFVIVILLCASCNVEKQKKQFFTESPELDVCANAINAYENQDWEAYRSFYNDTAEIWHNKNFDKFPGQHIDDYIANIKDDLDSLVYFRIDGDISEMIIDNGGNKWVYLWAYWVGQIAKGTDELEIPFHIAFHVEDGKIIEEIGFWDNLPRYQIMQQLKIESTP